MDNWTLPLIDLDTCTHCGRCVSDCPHTAVTMTGEGPVFTDPKACTYCGICETICPEGSVSLIYTIGWAPEASA